MITSLPLKTNFIQAKNLFTLIFALCTLSASAQFSATLKIKDRNPICIERGHNFVQVPSKTTLKPYTIDAIDSTVTVYPANTSLKCTRCEAETETSNKEVRVTTWRRVVTTPKPLISKKNDFVESIDWGKNAQRANNKFISSSLDDIKKVATLKNDTLFIHKRIDPFTSIKEQATNANTLNYKNKKITFKVAIFDESAFYAGKNGTEIF